jgi:[acyl-carrier-protein] S-malonyltransferase
MAFACVFPGQGSQSVGMMAPLMDIAVVRETLAAASEVLGYDVAHLMREGPETQLNTTEFTQPVMLAAGIATWRLWCDRGGVLPSVVSGHSLGEFTALVCAEVLDFATALQLVRTRGQLMQAAVPEGQGAMAALLGLEDSAVEQLCVSLSGQGVVEAVNFNAPGQVVIAGERAAVTAAIEAAKTQGAKRAVLLPVSVPSHSSLMHAAAERFETALTGIQFSAPRITYISAVDAEPYQAPEDIRRLLARQLRSPVRWQSTVRALAIRGIAQLLECGPGRVLTGLNKRIERGTSLACLSLDDAASIEAALQLTAESAHAE